MVKLEDNLKEAKDNIPPYSSESLIGLHGTLDCYIQTIRKNPVLDTKEQERLYSILKNGSDEAKR